MTNWIFFILLIIFTTRSNGAKCNKYRNIVINDTITETIKRTLVDGKDNFGLNLLKALYLEQKANNASVDIFFSPESVWSALFITYMGAQRTTKHEMRRVLGLSSTDKATLWKVYNYSKPQLLSTSYKSANRIFVQEGYIFKKCLKELLENDLDFVNFVSNPEEARTLINSFVEEKTENKIKDLVPAEMIENSTRLVIVNAIYFKDSWLRKFDPSKTSPEKFFITHDSEIDVNMMKITGPFFYNFNRELQCSALELPYSGNSSMVILLPSDAINGIDSLVNNLTITKFRDLIKDLKVRRKSVKVQLPVFQIQDTFELSPTLSHMGLRTLFDPDEVDLSGFNEQKERLEFAVVHKSYIHVNEEGTEASVATTARIGIAKTGASQFVANRPFIFFILNRLQNSILFVGIVQRPLEI